MSTLRWGIIATHVPASGEGGGMIRYTVELARALSVRDDIKLTVFTSTQGRRFFRELLGEDATVKRIPGSNVIIRSWCETFVLGRSTSDLDVLQGTKHLLPRRPSSRISLLTIHDTLPMDRPSDFKILKRTLLPRQYLRSTRVADLCLCVSEASRRRLVFYAPDSQSKAEVVPLAVSTSLLNVDSRRPVDLPTQDFALCVGDWSERKNIATLLDAWKILGNSSVGLKLVLVGPPSWREPEALQTKLQSAGDSVARLGRVSDHELRFLYEKCRLVLCPSLLEGFGLPVAEAAAFGCQILRSSDPAMNEIPTEFATTVYANTPDGWANAIKSALDKPVRNSDSPTTTRTWDDVADETVSLVKRAL